MDLECKLESICKNRMNVKSNNAIVRESLHLIGIFLLIAGLLLGLVTLLDVAVNELTVIMNWSKAPIVIAVTFIIQSIVIWQLRKFQRKNKIGAFV